MEQARVPEWALLLEQELAVALALVLVLASVLALAWASEAL